jgi:hypothetical protein
MKKERNNEREEEGRKDKKLPTEDNEKFSTTSLKYWDLF